MPQCLPQDKRPPPHRWPHPCSTPPTYFHTSLIQANAGAGGAMMALASDLVWCQRDVVLNPHYKLMGLYGR